MFYHSVHLLGAINDDVYMAIGLVDSAAAGVA